VQGSLSISTIAGYTDLELNPPVFDELVAVLSTESALHLKNLSTFANEGIHHRNWTIRISSSACCLVIVQTDNYKASGLSLPALTASQPLR
jgi:hypothetical protein